MLVPEEKSQALSQPFRSSSPPPSFFDAQARGSTPAEIRMSPPPIPSTSSGSPQPIASTSSQPMNSYYNGSLSGSMDADEPFELDEEAKLLIDTYLPSENAEAPPPYDGRAIVPFCLPQCDSKASSPFARGYNTALGCSQDDFLSFVDGLNLAMTASPPLRIVDIAGKVIEYIPNNWSVISNAAAQVGGGKATRVLSKTLTDRYMRSANERLFHARGLSARICTTPAALELIGAQYKKVSKVDKFGRTVSSFVLQLPIPLPIIRPIFTSIVHAVADKPPMSDLSESAAMATLRRKLSLVQGKALPVELNNLPMPKSTIVSQRAGARGLALEQRIKGKKRLYADERRSDHLARLRDMSESDREFEFNRRTDRQLATDELQDHWKEKDVLWIVIMDRKFDKAIEGVDQVDDSANTESVPESTWKEEVGREKGGRKN